MRQARDTFWRGGYAATSLEDLSAGMGMNRPSIYAAFGDKRALYLQALTEYGDTSRAWLATALARPRSLPDGLRAVYRNARNFYLAGDVPRGCFLLQLVRLLPSSFRSLADALGGEGHIVRAAE